MRQLDLFEIAVFKPELTPLLPPSALGLNHGFDSAYFFKAWAVARVSLRLKERSSGMICYNETVRGHRLYDPELHSLNPHERGLGSVLMSSNDSIVAPCHLWVGYQLHAVYVDYFFHHQCSSTVPL